MVVPLRKAVGVVAALAAAIMVRDRFVGRLDSTAADQAVAVVSDAGPGSRRAILERGVRV